MKGLKGNKKRVLGFALALVMIVSVAAGGNMFEVKAGGSNTYAPYYDATDGKVYGCPEVGTVLDAEDVFSGNKLNDVSLGFMVYPFMEHLDASEDEFVRGVYSGLDSDDSERKVSDIAALFADASKGLVVHSVDYDEYTDWNGTHKTIEIVLYANERPMGIDTLALDFNWSKLGFALGGTYAANVPNDFIKNEYVDTSEEYGLFKYMLVKTSDGWSMIDKGHVFDAETEYAIEFFLEPVAGYYFKDGMTFTTVDDSLSINWGDAVSYFEDECADYICVQVDLGTGAEIIEAINSCTDDNNKPGTWKHDGIGWWYLNANGTYPVNIWREIDNVTYYFNASGYIVTDWQSIDGVWYYFNSSGAMMTGWQSIGGVWYYFNSSGAMMTGWQSIGGVWYYFNSSGAMMTGWQSIDGVWYYFNSSGAMMTGWQSIDGVWYYFNGSGAMVTGWQSIGGVWYYFNGSGAMVTGWQSIGGVWYYFNSDGAMVSNQWVGNYYLQADGSMAVNKRIGIYYVGADGAWIPGKTETEELDRPPLSHEHDYKKKIVKPTCTSEGYTSYTCECGDSYTADKTAKTEHSYTSTVIAPTCTTEGYTSYVCECGSSYIGDKTAETGAHSYKTTARVEPQCGNDGYVEKTCEYCNKSYKTTLPAQKEHDYISTNTVDPTPTEDGYWDYTCSECGATKREIISWADDQAYTIDLGNGQTTTVVGHFIEDGMAEEIVKLMNQKRLYIANVNDSEYVPLQLAKSGTPLAEAAKTRAVEITYDYSHVRPNGERAITSFNQSAGTIAENIAKNQKSAQEVFDAWANSTGHNQAMINTLHGNVGIAIFARKVGEGVYVNHFVELFSR